MLYYVWNVSLDEEGKIAVWSEPKRRDATWWDQVLYETATHEDCNLVSYFENGQNLFTVVRVEDEDQPFVAVRYDADIETDFIKSVIHAIVRRQNEEWERES